MTKQLPFVTIIVPTWLPENKKYLDACIRSVMNLDYPKDQLNIMCVGRPGYEPQYDQVWTCNPAKEQFFCTEGMNYAAGLAPSKTDYLFLMNDDVILTRSCLRNLVDAAEDKSRTMLLNPICNSDFIHHDLVFQASLGKFDTPLELGNASNLMRASSSYRRGIFFPDFLPMSNTLIPKKIWNELGGLDPEFWGGADDVDFSWRAKEAGYRLGFTLNAMCWHFGGVTISKTTTPKIWLHNTEYFLKKWGRYPGEHQKKYHQHFIDEAKKCDQQT